MKTFLKVKLCPNCRWNTGVGMCKHPQLVDVATGENTECTENRSFMQETEQVTLPHCGPEGLFWEEKPVPQLTGPGTPPNHAI